VFDCRTKSSSHFIGETVFDCPTKPSSHFIGETVFDCPAKSSSHFIGVVIVRVFLFNVILLHINGIQYNIMWLNLSVTLQQIGGFPHVPRFPPPIKLTATI
jgi:hypothetical protein